MLKNITVINGQHEARPECVVSALTAAYLAAANRAGHRIRRLDLSDIEPQEPPRSEQPRSAMEAARQAIIWADHLVLIYPHRLGGPSGRFKAFCEAAFRRPGIAAHRRGQRPSARLVVAMGRPNSIVGCLIERARVRAAAHGMLAPGGFGSVRFSVVYGDRWPMRRRADLARMARCGAAGA